jgi:hypothetical protein
MKPGERRHTVAEQARARLHRYWTMIARALAAIVTQPAGRSVPLADGYMDAELAVGHNASTRSWTPARPALRPDVSPRLTYPLGSSLQPGLRQEAASHIRRLRWPR